MSVTEKHDALRVVIVDEDEIQLRPLVSELELRGLSVTIFTDADQCLDFVETKRRVDLFVVDIMLPSKHAYSRELTENFQLTGLRLGRDIRRTYVDVPIILFSNTSRQDLVTEIRAVARKIQNCVFIQKYTITQLGHFSEMVERILAIGTKEIGNKTVWERIKESVFIKPSIGGVGVDLKQLTKKHDP